MPNESESTPRVVYVLGSQRGGTTLLGRLLGEIPGFDFIGELRLLWEVSLPERRTCGCGLPHDECPTWRPIVGEVLDDATIRKLQDLQRRAEGRFSGLSLTGAARRRRGTAREAYTDLVITTYQALARTNGAVLVDGSKLPLIPALLADRDEVDLRVVHLLRHPSGVTSSELRWTATQRWPRLRAARFALSWILRHRAGRHIARRLGPGRATTVRYEDLVADPRAVVASLASFAGTTSPDLSFLDGNRARLSGAHTPSDRAGVLAPGEVEIALDRRWQRDPKLPGAAVARVLTALPRRLAGY